MSMTDQDKQPSKPSPESPKGPSKGPSKGQAPPQRNPLQWFLLLLLGFLTILFLLSAWSGKNKVTYSQLQKELEAGNLAEGNDQRPTAFWRVQRADPTGHPRHDRSRSQRRHQADQAVYQYAAAASRRKMARRGRSPRGRDQSRRPSCL